MGRRGSWLPVYWGGARMGFDATCFVGGVEWVYRLRDDAVSKCVRILAVPPKKNSTRLDAAFVGNSGGRVEERSGIPVAGAVESGRGAGPLPVRGMAS